MWQFAWHSWFAQLLFRTKCYQGKNLSWGWLSPCHGTFHRVHVVLHKRHLASSCVKYVHHRTSTSTRIWNRAEGLTDCPTKIALTIPEKHHHKGLEWPTCNVFLLYVFQSTFNFKTGQLLIWVRECTCFLSKSNGNWKYPFHDQIIFIIQPFGR